MAKYLIQTGDEDRDRLREAAALLEGSLDVFLSEEQLSEAKKLLATAGSRSRSFEEIQQVRSLLEAASGKARKAAALLREGRTPAKVRAARDEIEAALHEAGEAEEIAVRAELKTAAANARELADGLRKMIEDIEK
jgi:hypothetical protein